MKTYDELIFSAVTEIVAATMEETEVELNAEGGRQVAEYFLSIYNALAGEEAPAVCEQPPCEGHYEVIRDAGGEYRFCLKAGNGEIIAVSEGYKKKASCLNGIDSVRRNAPGEVVDLSKAARGKKKAARSSTNAPGAPFPVVPHLTTRFFPPMT